MATAMKKCRVCGKLYEACHTMRQTADTFRWQEVACSPECGSIYLARIEASRKTDEIESVKVIQTVIEVEDEDDDIDFEEFSKELDEYFDDAE